MTGHGRCPAEGLRERKKRATSAAIHEVALRQSEERGIDAATVETISEEVGISARTFFNYYPSKAAAILGVTIVPLDDERRQAFLTSDGDLVADLCDLLASQLSVPAEMARVHAIFRAHPDLVEDARHRMGPVRDELKRLTRQRVDDPLEGRLAVALVMSAFGLVIQSGGPAEGPTLGQRLREAVGMIGEYARDRHLSGGFGFTS